VKKVVYTAIIGKYDVLKEPKIISEEFDYVCFTDDVTLKSPVWKIIPINNSEGLDNVRMSRKIKILCNNYLKEYDLSIWIDGSVEIKCDLNIFLDNNYHGEDNMVPTHPLRSCIYEEAKNCIKSKQDDPTIIKKQMKNYRKEGYPAENGLVSSNLIIRNHHGKKIDEFMNSWWNEVKFNSRRDQLSFNYTLWKHKISVGYLDAKKVFSSDFKWYRFHPKPIEIQLEEANSELEVIKKSFIYKNSKRIAKFIDKFRI